MNCKNKDCYGGTIYKDGIPFGPCDCVIEKQLNLLFKWSQAKPEHKKQLHQLEKDYEIKGKVGDKTGVTTLKKTIQGLVTNKEALIADNTKILLMGTPGTGKTQMAATTALEIAKDMKFVGNQLKTHQFFFLSLSKLIQERKLFDEEAMKSIWNRINQSSVLIIDDLGEENELQPKKIQKGSEIILIEDKRKEEVLSLLKTILDSFEGLLFITTNLNDITKIYKKDQPRLHSRLFGDMSKRENIYTYMFDLKKDLRDEQKTTAAKNMQNLLF